MLQERAGEDAGQVSEIKYPPFEPCTQFDDMITYMYL